MDQASFVARFGGVFEHSPWIAEHAHAMGLDVAHDTAHGLHDVLVAVFRSATAPERLAVLKAHPDLAGRLAQAKVLTAESTAEQASAGLDRLTPQDLARFSDLNARYQAKFGFPFIMAVKGKTTAEILAAFERRMGNDRDREFATATAEVERIALLRLQDMLP